VSDENDTDYDIVRKDQNLVHRGFLGGISGEMYAIAVLVATCLILLLLLFFNHLKK